MEIPLYNLNTITPALSDLMSHECEVLTIFFQLLALVTMQQLLIYWELIRDGKHWAIIVPDFLLALYDPDTIGATNVC